MNFLSLGIQVDIRGDAAAACSVRIWIFGPVLCDVSALGLDE